LLLVPWTEPGDVVTGEYGSILMGEFMVSGYSAGDKEDDGRLNAEFKTLWF